MEHFLRSRRDYRLWAAFLTGSVFCAVLGFLFFVRFPVRIPLVDDWLLVPWATREVFSMPWESFFHLLNGHQHVLMKIYTALWGHLLDADFPISALISAVLGVTGGVFAVRSIPGRSRPWAEIALGVGFVSFWMGLRQMQNFFLLICFPWMLAMICIGMFCYLHTRRLQGVSTGTASLVGYLAIVFLSALTNGLGLGVALFVLTTAVLKGFTGLLSREKLIAAAVAIFALFVAMVLPKFVDGENHGSVSLSSGLRYVISHPFHTLQALLASMGQPFAPWMSENSLRVGVAYGTVIAVVLLLLLIEAVRSGGLRKLVSDLDSNPLLWIGIIFIFTLVVGRLGSLGPVGVIEPRYTTGSLLVWLGTLAYLWQSSKAQRFRYWVAALCLCSGVWVNWSVGRYGLDYLRYQSAQSEKFVGCLAGPQSPGFEACRDLLYPGDWLGREFYNKYLRVLQVEKKAVFQSE